MTVVYNIEHSTPGMRDCCHTIESATPHRKFDLREHQKDRPLSFRKLAQQWLQSKEDQTKPASLPNHFNTVTCAHPSTPSGRG